MESFVRIHFKSASWFDAAISLSCEVTFEFKIRGLDNT